MPYRDSDDTAWPFPDDEWDPELGHQYLNEYMDQLELADELGFDAVGINEHHFSVHSSQPSPNLSAAHLADRTEQADIAILGNIIGLRENPIRVAEEVAWLDNLTGGRIISGFPRGIPGEYLSYNVDWEESRPRHEEAWDLIKKAWTAEEPFDWDGEYFQYENVFIRPRPYQEPHPELWMAATSEASHHFTAERRIPIGVPFQKTERMAESFGNFRDIAETEYGWTPADDDFTVARKIYVAETSEQAREEAEEHIDFFYEKLEGLFLGVVSRFMGQKSYDPEMYDTLVENFPPDGKMAHEYEYEEYRDAGAFIVGSPAEVTAELERQYEQLGGFGRFAGLFQFGSLPHEKTVKNMELFADEVMPEIAKL
jgi:alkanesulfonate monooxygenase SsuD/methylene tetrahydromethanopterin reductase-like flavin-dependent oxidoreductase (luciferase family)